MITEVDGAVTFPPDHAVKLKPLGLLLSACRGRIVFGPNSWFEPPVVVHSIMSASIQVGAFSGVPGRPSRERYHWPLLFDCARRDNRSE